jgi:hypothetical protein
VPSSSTPTAPATTATSTASASPIPTVNCFGTWHTAIIFNGSGTTITAVEAVAPDDVWVLASGTMHHFDGVNWFTVSYPVPSGMGGSLSSLDGWASDDVWAGGSYADIGGNVHPLIEHWDGSSWTIKGMFASPQGGTLDDIKAVAAVGPGEAWGVGGISFGTGAILRHCTASGGCTSTPPNTGQTELHGVSGANPNDVWAVGYRGGLPLMLHWNGSVWSEVSVPNIGALNAVDVIASNDVWASSDSAFIHWNGSQWSTIPSDVGALTIGAVSSNDIWAAGQALQHWDGTAWGIFPYPTNAAPFHSISALAQYDVWAGGEFGTVLHYTAQHYADVPPGNAFFNHINYMTCLGIMSGYSCGGPGEPCDEDQSPYFRPNNPLIRGQLAKIVSNAAGLADDPGEQIYEDVLPNNVFYPYIQRLTHAGVMGGYPCGGDNEPCVPPGNRPYFRTYAEATRGQISKIVANAAGIGGTPTGIFYTDVPEDHPFYVWIMRLTQLGVMSGYPCGDPGEPCDPENRPYFRPFNNATRGQTSKIVANTFFPGCCARR